MVRPNDKREYSDKQHRTHHGFVAEDRFTCVGRDDLGCNSKCGKQYNIYLRVSKEPEQVLEQYRASSHIRQGFPCNIDIRQVEARSEAAVEYQQQRRCEQNREGKQPDNSRKKE